MVTPVANVPSAARNSDVEKAGVDARRGDRFMRQLSRIGHPDVVRSRESRSLECADDCSGRPRGSPRRRAWMRRHCTACWWSCVLGFASGPAARADRPGDAGLAQHRGRRHRDDRLPEPGRPALHLQVPVGTADGPLRAAVARPASRLAGADAARARRRAGLDRLDAAGRRDPQLRAAGLPGRLHLGLAGRRHRRLPHRPARRQRARPRLVAERARLPARDDPVGRRRVDLGRRRTGRRLDLAGGLPLHGRPDGRCRGAVGDRAAAPEGRAAAVERGAPRRRRLPRGRRRGRRSASSSAIGSGRRSPASCSSRCCA